MLTVVLLVFSTVLYFVVSINLDRNLNQVLSLRARDTAVSLVAHWLLERNRRSYSYSGDIQSFDELIQDKGEFGAFIQRWAFVRKGINEKAAVRLIDLNGRVVYVADNFPAQDIAATRFMASRRKFFKRVDLESGKYRILHYPVWSKDRKQYSIQVAASLSEHDASLGNLRTALLILVPLAVLLTSGVGWFLAWRAMRPIDVMVEQAKHISAFRLNERLNVPGTGDELEKMALTFNDLLERIERSFLRLRQFSGAASHELRTPLTVMRGELEVALRRDRSPEEYKEALQTTLKAIEDLTQIVEDLLTFARSHTEEDTLKTEPINLVAVAKTVHASWQIFARQKGVQLIFNEPHIALNVLGESRLLERLLANLLDNAIRHTPEGGQVTIELEVKSENAELRVKDTGPGIDPQDKPRIFDRFFSQRGKPEDGSKITTGLGLGLCRWIAEAHNGSIDVVSEQFQGATFIVGLPLAR